MNEIIAKQIDKLQSQRETLTYAVSNSDYNNMNNINKVMELKEQINNIDANIENLLNRLM